MASTTQCAICTEIADCLQGKYPNPGLMGWTYQELIENRQCHTCQELVSAFGDFEGSRSQGDFFGQLNYDDELRLWSLGMRDCNEIRHSAYPEVSLAYGDAISTEFSESSFDFPDTEHTYTGEATLFPIPGPVIDLSILKHWIQQCDHGHLGRCHFVSDPWATIERATGLIFIDVKRQCLVKELQDSKPYEYAALSYVWGTATDDQFQTTVSNIDSLSQDNAFDLPANHVRIPKTIQHSILLARALNIPFLWVDKFCIVQDDLDAKPHQLAAMASIYANAYITFVASEGRHGDVGLRGLLPDCPRPQPFRSFHFSDDCTMIEEYPVMAQESIHGVELQDMGYHTRGWTFQEYAVARRKLIFHDHTVSWVCQVTRQQENGPRPLTQLVPGSYRAEKADSIWTAWPNARSYFNMVQDYSHRDLQYPADALNAFEAIMTVHGRAMKGGMLYGLPELFFSSALLWTPLEHGSMRRKSNTHLRRRTDKSGNLLKAFPSWSWAGWTGPVSTNLAVLASDCVQDSRHRPPPSYVTSVRVVDFYKSLKDTIFKVPTLIQDIVQLELDLGPPKEVMDDNLLPNNLFFKRSVPLVENHNMVDTKQDVHFSPIIRFHTRQLYARLVKYDDQQYRMDNPLIVNPHGKVIGYLDIYLSFLEVALPVEPIQLICIGKMELEWGSNAYHVLDGLRYLHRHCDSYCYEPELKCLFPHGYKHSFYNVLWVVWDDGIAYRKAVGRVWEEDWDAGETEEVDVRLG